MKEQNTDNRIKAAGLRVTPQRKAVYECLQELGHATIEMVVEKLNEKKAGINLSTDYRILDSFCEAGLVRPLNNPCTGKLYYDVTMHSHHHIFNPKCIQDLNDPALTALIRRYLDENNIPTDEKDIIQVQIIAHNV